MELKKEIIKLYSEGYSTRQIGKMLNKSYTSIRFHLMSVGFPLRGRGTNVRAEEGEGDPNRNALNCYEELIYGK